jgi:hypothetical protein
VGKGYGIKCDAIMNSLGKRSVSITEIDWEPCENMLKTSKSKKIFSRPKGGKLG